MKKFRLFYVGLFALLAGAGMAHDDKWLDQQTAPNGGQLRMAGLYHLELVVKSDALELHLSDHAGTPQKAEGSSAQVTLIANKKVTKATLTPSGAHALNAKGTFPVSEDVQAIVVFTAKGEKPLQAKFTPFKKATASDHHNHDHSHEKPLHSHDHDNEHNHGEQHDHAAEKHSHDDHEHKKTTHSHGDGEEHTH